MSGRFTALSDNPEATQRGRRRRPRKRSPQKNSRFDALQTDQSSFHKLTELPKVPEQFNVQDFPREGESPRERESPIEDSNEVLENTDVHPEVTKENSNFDYTAALLCKAETDRNKQSLRPGQMTLPLSRDNQDKILREHKEINLQLETNDILYRRWIIERCQKEDRIRRELEGEIFYPDELGFEYQDWDIDDSDDESYGKQEYNDWICERKR